MLVLAEHFGRRMASEMHRDGWPGFTRAAEAALIAYAWPGNVRELRNVVERAVYRWDADGPIDAIQFDPFHSPHRPVAAHPMVLPAPVASVASAPGRASEPDPDAPTDYKSRLARFEYDLLQTAMSENRFNQRATAEALGLSYDQLRHALRRHGLISGAVAESVA